MSDGRSMSHKAGDIRLLTISRVMRTAMVTRMIDDDFADEEDKYGKQSVTILDDDGNAFC